MRCFSSNLDAGFWGQASKSQVPGTFTALLSLFILLFLVSTSVAGSTTITIRERSTINEKMIHLGKISDIMGEDHGLNHRLESIVIGRSPLPGKSRFIDRDYIKVRIKQNKIDPSKVEIRYPERILICRDYLRVSKSEIREIMIDYIYKNIPWNKESVNIKTIKVPSDLILPKGNITYKVTPLKYWGFLGRTSMPVIFKVNKTFHKKVWVTVEIEVFADVVVSTVPIGKYRIVSREDIHMGKRNLSSLPRNIITRLDEVIGKRTKRAIDANFAMTADILDMPPVVRRGDMVTLTVETEILKITTPGEARENGIKGEIIKVLNIASKKEVYGRVLDSNTVKVKF